jgi:hypothetical protein
MNYSHQFCGYFLLPTLWQSKFFCLALSVAIETFQLPRKEGVSYVFGKPSSNVSHAYAKTFDEGFPKHMTRLPFLAIIKIQLPSNNEGVLDGD